jgi:hypothetical protein
MAFHPTMEDAVLFDSHQGSTIAIRAACRLKQDQQ